VTPHPVTETLGCHRNWISITNKAHGIYLLSLTRYIHVVARCATAVKRVITSCKPYQQPTNKNVTHQKVENETNEVPTEFDQAFLERNQVLLKKLRLHQEHED